MMSVNKNTSGDCREGWWTDGEVKDGRWQVYHRITKCVPQNTLVRVQSLFQQQWHHLDLVRSADTQVPLQNQVTQSLHFNKNPSGVSYAHKDLRSTRLRNRLYLGKRLFLGKLTSWNSVRRNCYPVSQWSLRVSGRSCMIIRWACVPGEGPASTATSLQVR